MPLVLVLFGRFTTVPICQTRYKNTNIWTVTQSTAVLYCLVTNNRSAYIVLHLAVAHLASLRRVCQFQGIFDTSIVAQGVIIVIIVIVIVWISLSKLGLVMMPPRFLSPFHSSLEVSSLLYLSYICNVFVLCCIVFVMFFKCICNVFVCFSLFSGSQFSTVLY